MKTANVVIVGGGVVGCCVAYYLAKNGANGVVLLERNAFGSGGTGKSCAIVRTHYSVRANLIHAVESLKILANFNETVGGESGFHRTGYLILGPESHRGPMEAVFRTQNEHGIDTRTLNPTEAWDLHPLLQFDDVEVIGYDSLAGFCDPHLVTNSYAQRAKDLGVLVCPNTEVTRIRFEHSNKVVDTTNGSFECPVVVIAAGPWANQIGSMFGVQFPFVITRHNVVTLRITSPYQINWPIVKDLTTPDKIYFRPETGGVVLVGTGDHGDPIKDPDSLTDLVDQSHIQRIEKLISNRMPAFADADYVAGWTGPYDITPDWNPIVGPVASSNGLYIATGFSGHGFKLAPTIGEGLAQLILGEEPRIPIEMYAPDRFQKGHPLHGAYGIGSIS